MKRILLTFLIFSICHLAFGQDSKTKIGIELAPTMATIKAKPVSTAYNYRIGYLAGLTLERIINGKFSIKSGLIYERKGAVSNILLYDKTGAPSGTRDLKINSDYLIVPILISSNTQGKTRFYINAGPFFGLLLSNKSRFGSTYDLPRETVDGRKNMHESDIGLTFGIGLNIPVNEFFLLDMGVRDNLGLFNISKIDLTSYGIQYSIKNNSLCFQIGIKLNLSGA